MSEPGYRPVLQAESGTTLLASGTIRFAEVQKFIENPDLLMDEERKLQAGLARAHEFVHFIQTFTTAYIFRFAESVRRLTTDFATLISSPNMDPGHLVAIIDEIRNLERLHDLPSDPLPLDGAELTARQVWESVAIIESHRAWNPDVSFADLAQDVAVNSRSSTVYSAVLGTMVRHLCDGCAVNLTPPLAYVALNTEKPGESMAWLINELYGRPHSEVHGMNAQQILNEYASGMAVEGIIAAFANGARPSRSEYYNELGYRFSSAGSMPDMIMIATHPSLVLRDSRLSRRLDQQKIEFCTPPLVIYSDGRGREGKLVQELDAQGPVVLMLDELIGVLYASAFPARYTTACQQTKCPTHESGACHLAYPQDPEIFESWRDCPFRIRFESISGQPPEAFLERVAKLQETVSGRFPVETSHGDGRRTGGSDESDVVTIVGILGIDERPEPVVLMESTGAADVSAGWASQLGEHGWQAADLSRRMPLLDAWQAELSRDQVKCRVVGEGGIVVLDGFPPLRDDWFALATEGGFITMFIGRIGLPASVERDARLTIDEITAGIETGGRSGHVVGARLPVRLV